MRIVIAENWLTRIADWERTGEQVVDQFDSEWGLTILGLCVCSVVLTVAILAVGVIHQRR